MSLLEAVKWVHLLAVATWTGGLITLAALVPVLRRRGVDTETLRAVARRFGALSWGALGLAVATGIWQVTRLSIAWTDHTLSLKLGLVTTAAGLALLHQITARRTTAAVRGLVQGLILVASVAIFGVAVTL